MKPNLDELERLAKRVDPLPWKLNLQMGKVVRYTEHGNERFIADCLRVTKRDAHCKRNAAYITAACNATPELIKMYREAEDKANNAWRILLEAQARIVEVQKRVQELEAQRNWLASKLGDMCSVSSRDSCGASEPCPYSKGYCRCLDVEQEEWVQVAKETKC